MVEEEVAMAARAYWKGHLRLSLVSIGIELYSAAKSSGRLSLRQLHKPSGKRIRYQKTAPGIGPVNTDDIVKGFEIAKDEYVILDSEELEEIKLDSKHTIDLVQFVDQCEIDPRYFNKPYYVTPEDNAVAEEGFAVIRDALRKSGKTGLGQMAVRGRDYIAAIRPCGDGLLLETLRYAEEIRESDEIFRHIPDVEPSEEMMDLALELVERKSAPFEADIFKSQYASAMRELIEQKRKKGKVTPASDEEIDTGDNVIDLMEALKKSVSKDKKKSTTRRKSTTRKKSSSSKRKAS